MLQRNRPRISGILSWCRRAAALGVLLVLVCVLTWPRVSLAQRDICGCSGNPNNLGAFDTADEATWPPGTVRIPSIIIAIPLPEDGILIFDSFTVSRHADGNDSSQVRFIRNAANTPVTLLVAGDVTIAVGSSIDVRGESGTSGPNGGMGGLGGPGGFRGGDGAFQLVTLTGDAGAGFGPGGGAPGTASPLTSGGTGTFIGVPELLPMLGGSGGGGGGSSTISSTCSGGGGGGGGGAILIVANGTITVNGTIFAGGGSGGGRGNFFCAGSGGSGSRGAIRLVADTITGTGSATAAGVRLEAFTNNLAANQTSPPASRAPAPGPVSNPLTPKVAITAVNGQMVSLASGQLISELPQGGFGEVDVIVSAPGPTTIELAMSGVPSGTEVEVTVKPRVGGVAIVENITLDPADCNAAGDCDGSVTVDLPAGAYTIEARATFQTS